jgi:hypothetical protein
MLLPEESDAVEHLARARARRFETALEVRVFLFQLVHPFRIHAGAACRGIESLDSRFGLKSAAPEHRKLVTEVADQLLKLLEGFDVRTFAV